MCLGENENIELGQGRQQTRIKKKVCFQLKDKPNMIYLNGRLH
jgi:hypothetical protein